jgi:hypothetical protein
MLQPVAAAVAPEQREARRTAIKTQ